MAKKAKKTTEFPSKEDLFRQLSAAPIVDVLGILAASGVGGGRLRGETLWTLVIPFASWRVGGGQLHTNELIVRRLVRREAEIKRYDKLIKPDTVIKIRARVVENSICDRPEALLVKIVGPDASDAELNTEVQRLQKPVRFKDKIFGTFTLDRRINWFETKTLWNGERIRLTLELDQSADVERALHSAHKLWRSQKTWSAKILAYAVKELLPLKNDLWLDTDEKNVSSKQFKNRMTLESISVRPDGEFEFWYHDGELFFGHQIEIAGNLTRGLKSAGIHG